MRAYRSLRRGAGAVVAARGAQGNPTRGPVAEATCPAQALTAGVASIIT
ncbi:MAG: hypothetical protein ACJ74W_10955 [Pyrinomonadaceae bacterium]